MKTIVIKTQEEMDAIYRLFSKSKKDSESCCINWIGFKDKKGYGRLSVDDKLIEAHRLSFKIFNGGKIPKGKVIAHECDNPSCINPLHLKAVTHKKNINDAVKRGLIKTGTDSPNSVISKKDSKEILRLRGLGFTIVGISKKMNITRGPIQRFLQFKK